MKETDFHDWLQKTIPGASNVLIGIGDDAAVLDTNAPIAVASDMLVENVHFIKSECSAEQIGAKAVNRNLSDMAAMGLSPDWILVSAAVPSGTPEAFSKALVKGIRDAAARFGATLVGGDMSSSPHGLVLDVTVIARVRDLAPVTRSGAKPGDRIFVTGSLGGSLQGKHLDFTPRVTEGLFLNRSYTPTAMIDISDGLALDLTRILDASGAGAQLNGDSIPISDAALEAAKTSGKTTLDHALTDGEDFELLFTLNPEMATKIKEDENVNFRVTEIGIVTADPNERTLHLADKHLTFGREGYDHSI